MSSGALAFGYSPSRFGGWVRGPLRRVSASLGPPSPRRSPARGFVDFAGGVGEDRRELADGERRGAKLLEEGRLRGAAARRRGRLRRGRGRFASAGRVRRGGTARRSPPVRLRPWVPGSGAGRGGRSRRAKICCAKATFPCARLPRRSAQSLVRFGVYRATILEEGFNQGNLDVCHELTADDLVVHQDFGPDHAPAPKASRLSLPRCGGRSLTFTWRSRT